MTLGFASGQSDDGCLENLWFWSLDGSKLLLKESFEESVSLP